MTAFHLLAGIFLHAMLNSLVAGILCYLILLIAFRLFAATGSAAKYFLCNAAQLLIAAAFLQPFLQEAFTSGSAVSTWPLRQVATAETSQPAISQIAEAGGPGPSASKAFSVISGPLLRLPERHAGLILVIYTCGLCFFLLKLIAGYYYMHRLRTKGLLAPDDMWQDQMSRACTRLHIRRPVRLAFSAIIKAPCIVGRAKSVVLIPVALAARLSVAQAEAVLLHELAHYRQYHHYLNLIGQVSASLQFFNPFVWIILRLGNRYREYACDEFTTRHSLQVALAESLVIIAQQSANPAYVLSLYSSKNQLLHRVQNLLQMKTPLSSSRTVITTFSVAFIAACCCYGTLRALPVSKNEKRTDTLAAISRQMQQQGNNNYVLLEAIRDSLIRFDAHYNFTYMAGKVYIDSVLLPEPYQSRYKTMVEILPANKQVSMWSSRGDGIHLKEVLDTGSSFRTCHASVVNTYYSQASSASSAMQPVNTPSSDGNTTAVLSALIADKLADTLKPVYIQYKGKALFINNKRLSDALEQKYEKLLSRHMSFTSVEADLWIYPEGVMAPAIRNGNSLIQFPRQPHQSSYLHAVPAGRLYAVQLPYEMLKNQLAADGLADTANTIHVLYTTKGIFINDKKLKGVQCEKYEDLLTHRFSYTGPKLESDLLEMIF